MDGVAAAKKGERKIDELFGYRQLELAAPETRTAPGQAGGRQAGGLATVVLLVPGSGEDRRKVSLRSERSPNVSDCSDPISIIIIVVVVAVIQFGSRKRDADAITGGKKRRNGFTDLLQFDSDGRGQQSEEPHLSAFGDGGLTGVPDEILSDQVQSLDSNISSLFSFKLELESKVSHTLYLVQSIIHCPVLLSFGSRTD